MRKKILGISTMILLAISSLTGCGHNEDSNSQNYSDENEAIIQEMKLLTEACDSKDSENIYDLLSDDLKNDTVKSALDEFEMGYSGSEKAYVNRNTYWEKDGDADEITLVSGIIVTKDNIYTVKFDFNADNNEITSLWIITGETESEENLNWADKYNVDSSEKFVYANYYDKGQTDYRLIWGMVVKWDDSAATVDKEDVESMLSDTTTIDDIVAAFGNYGADVEEAEHFYCYPASNEGEYTQIFVDESGTVLKVETTDSIDYGIMGLVDINE